MRDLGPADRLAVGAVGRPGERTFLIQVHAGGHVAGFVIEKAQAAALAREAGRLLAGAGFAGAGDELEPPEVDPDVVPEFRVVGMELRHLGATDMVTLVLAAEDQIEQVTVEVTTAQLEMAARGAADAVRSGRPRCPRCDLAMDPDGHACPAGNGDLRGHRP
jgi:uncharacterized repeat protein (TIGR03847 family)